MGEGKATQQQGAKEGTEGEGNKEASAKGQKKKKTT